MNPVVTQKKRRGFVHRRLPARSLGMTSKPFAFAFAFAATLSVALSQGCAAQLALEERACPCSEGWTCCPSRNMCVGPGETCGATQNPNELAEVKMAQCITLAGGYVYWQRQDGRSGRVPRGGGVSEELLTPLGDNRSCGIVAAGDLLLMTSYAVGKLWRWESGEGSATVFDGLKTPSSLALTKGGVVVTERDAGRVIFMRELLGSSRNLGGPEVLAEGQKWPDDVHVYASAGNAFAYFVEPGFSDSATGAIKRVDVDLRYGKRPVETLASGLEEPSSPVAVHGRLYFRTSTGIYSIPLDGGVPERVLEEASGPSTGLRGLVSDGTSLFVPTALGILRVSLDGREVTRYPNTPRATALAVDEKYIAWTDNVAVYTVAK